MQQKGLPPIKVLLTDSWHCFVKSLLPLVIISVITWVITGVLVVIMAIPFFILVGVNLMRGIGGKSINIGTFLPLIMPALIIFIITYIFFLILVNVIQIVMIKILDNPVPPFHYITLIKRGASIVLPFILLILFTNFFIFGGTFLFVLPGLFFAFIFSMAPYEFVIGGKSVLNSMRGSMQIVLSNFGGILLRFLLIMGIMLAIYIIPSILNSIDKTLGTYVGFFMFFVGFAASWFSLSYSITLYKQAAAVASPTPKSLLGPVIIAIIGYVLGILTLIAILGIVMAFISKAKPAPVSPIYRSNLTPPPSFYIPPTTPPTYVPSPTLKIPPIR